MKKNYYAKVLALTVAASMVSVPAFAEEGDGTAVAAQEQKKEGENEQISKDSEKENKEQTIEEETLVNRVTTQNALEDEPVALAEEDETQSEIAINSAEQIYALARILGDTGTDEDYQLFIPKNGTEGTDDETTSELTDAEKTALKAKLQTAKYELTDNISLSNENGFCGIPDFKGTFDGQGNIISVAFDIEEAQLTQETEIGCLFATLDGGTVKDVTFEGSFDMTGTVTAGLQDIAVVAGYTKNGATLQNITSDVAMNLELTTQGGNGICAYVGAMVGRASGGSDKLENCVNTKDLTAKYTGFTANGGCRLGGLIGHAYSGVSFENCKNSGDIDTSESGDTQTLVGGMVGSGSNNVYTNCELSGNVKGSGGYAVYAYPSMGEGSEENILVATVNGKAGQVIAYGSETKTIGDDGKVTFEIPIENKNGFVENNAFSYEQYLTVNGARLDWYNLDNTELTLKLDSADAGDLSVPFQTERDALEIKGEETLLNIQKALNEGDHTAIDALYALRDKTVAEGGYSEAKAALQTAYYKLGNDVTITNPAYTGIGTQTVPFSGHFDGQGYKVTLQPTSTVTASCYGLFGYVNSGANGIPEIENVNVVVNAENVEVSRSASEVGAFAGRIVAGGLKNITTTVEKLNVIGKADASLCVGGFAGRASANSMENISVKVNGPLTVNANCGTIDLGGAFGAGSPSDPLTVTFNERAQLKAENTREKGSVNFGGFVGYRDGVTVDFRGCKLVNNTGTTLDIVAKGLGWINVGGWLGYATSATPTADTWIYVDETSKMQGDFSIEAETTGASYVGGVVGYFTQAYSVSIENYINRASVKGKYAGGLIGGALSGNTKKVSLKNSANIGTVEVVDKVSYAPGGLIGQKGNVVFDSTGKALYLKSDTVTKGIGKVDDATCMVGFDTAKVTPTEDKIFTFGTPIADVLTADAPAALTIDGNAEFDGANLVYTKAGENQEITFRWNGEEIYKTTVNVAAKALTNKNVTITGVNSAYASDDEAAKADIKVLDGDKILVKGTDYDVTRTDGKFEITFKGNYEGSVEKTYSTQETFEVPVNDYVGNYDGTEHGIDVTSVPEGVEMQYKGVDGYTTTPIKETNAGVYTVEWKATKGGQTVTGTALIQINKAPVTLTADRTSMRGAGTVTLTVDGVVEGETVATGVSCDDASITVSDNENTYTAYLPNATKTYTFTATGTNSNYEWKDNSCTVSVSRKKSSSSSDTSAPTYGVSTGKTENGKISVTPAKAEAGEKVTIKATPDSGYQLDKVTVKDKDNSNVKLTKVNDNEYTFTMPKGKVSVDATFVQKDAADDNSVAEKSKVIKLQIGSRIVNVDNEAVIYDAAPVIRNDRTLVPIRIVTETLGGKVDWNGATKEVTLNIDGKEIKMTIGKTLEKYGVAPVIIDGRTFVPVRFVADELGATVAWDDATKTVTITKIEK
ncbi:stalk domain-containing protein [Anaerotignum faecicola]